MRTVVGTRVLHDAGTNTTARHRLVVQIPPAATPQSKPQSLFWTPFEPSSGKRKSLRGIVQLAVGFDESRRSVFVITRHDLRRSGVKNIPEALRMVPGMEVARITANKWAITARGFNGRSANTLLVLIDGRSIYTPTFCGVS